MFWKKKKKVRDQYQLNPKGIYSTRYIINKYVNEQEIDEIEAYEDIINTCQAQLEKSKYYDYIKSIAPDLPVDNPEIRHILAALMSISITLRVLVPEDREKCLQLITDENRRKNFEISLNSKMFKF